MKARDDFDLLPMLSAILNSMGLPDDSIQGDTIDAKAVACGDQFGINCRVDAPSYAASAGATLH